jgi:hypothetical protein
MTAFVTFAGGIVFEELNVMAAFRAFCCKNGSWFPVSAVLSWAFHVFSPYSDLDELVKSPFRSGIIHIIKQVFGF